MSKIILHCVRERTKLRIRVFSFIDSDGKVRSNVYDPDLNCQFPRNIRVEGFFYEIGPDDLEIIHTSGRSFYKLKNEDVNIKIISNEDRFVWLEEEEDDDTDDSDSDNIPPRNVAIRFFTNCCTRLQRFFGFDRLKIN